MNNRAFGNYLRIPGLTILAVLAVVLGCQPVMAKVPPGGYELTFVGNTAYGDMIADRRYGLAIRLLDRKSDEPVAGMINLCVARTLIGQFRAARRDCSRAVEMAEQAASTAPASSRDAAERNLAVALSNRGVLRAVRHQVGAEEDFLQALRLPGRRESVLRNLSSLQHDDYMQLVAAY